jgi:hypothetical protein
MSSNVTLAVGGSRIGDGDCSTFPDGRTRPTNERYLGGVAQGTGNAESTALGN